VSPTPAATPSAVQSSAPPTSVLPATCRGLYGEALTITLEQLSFELGSNYAGQLHSGSVDAELRALLDDAAGTRPALDCHWTTPGTGLLTRVVEVDEQQQAAAAERLGQLGFTLLREHDGLRYVTEWQTAGGASGESHFFREGVWFATHWVGHGQYGYTADMVRSVFD
jgi:hypothetical protein